MFHLVWIWGIRKVGVLHCHLHQFCRTYQTALRIFLQKLLSLHLFLALGYQTDCKERRVFVNHQLQSANNRLKMVVTECGSVLLSVFMANAFIEIRINLYLVMHLYQLFIVYVSFSSFWCHVHDYAHMTTVSLQTYIISVDVCNLSLNF